MAIVVREDLATWQKLNVTAFLASGIAHACDDIMGKRYEDASANDYLALLREPVLCFAADDLDLVGVAVHGPRKPVDKVIKGLKLHG
ncbi:DUF2000 domain-containing protein [Streptomyces chrestomyceticus]